jgi:glycosyltransferase involved in cell wall biosynthesis
MISIIIPAYKEEKWIADTIRQFGALKTPHEVIVSDGKSLDRTVEISLQYTDKVVVYEGQRHHNAAIGRNDGAKIAKGEYLVFIDSSVVIPDVDAFFKRALAHFENDPNLVALGVPQWIDPKVATTADRIILFITNRNLRLLNNVLGRGMISGKCMMIRKTAFDRVGGFRESLAVGEDGDISQRLSHIGRTYVDPELYILYPGRREHALGWPRLLWQWTYYGLSVALLKKSPVDRWEAIR